MVLKSATNLEELEYIQNGLDFYRSDFAWASDEIYDLVDSFHRRERIKGHFFSKR